jgi:hypothetical protein
MSSSDLCVLAQDRCALSRAQSAAWLKIVMAWYAAQRIRRAICGIGVFRHRSHAGSINLHGE